MQVNDEYILLSEESDANEKMHAANNIITKHEINLSTEQILAAFGKLRLSLARFGVVTAIYYFTCERYSLVMRRLPEVNKSFYIAIIIGLSNNSCTLNPRSLIQLTETNCDGVIALSGKMSLNSGYPFIELLNYCDFNIDNLGFSEQNMEEFECAYNARYSGKSIKSAVQY
jgi:Zn-dependent alcohol dehydrogenase